jgi:hypothetical protein
MEKKEAAVTIDYYFLPGYEVEQLVEALRYKPEVHGFDVCWRHWAFSMTYSFRSPYDPGVEPSSYTNGYQVYILVSEGGIGMKTLPTSCADCLKILGASTTWSPGGLLASV